MSSLLSGIIAAPFTPFGENGALNLSPIPRYAERLAADGVAGAFVCGTTGEGSSLTEAERRAVAGTWCMHRPKGLKVIVHVGHNSRDESVALAAHAQDHGADAIATLAPHFFRPASIDDLLDWCVPVAAAAPRIPFYYYHMPAMAGADFAMAEFLPRAAARIPNLGGIKFTHENLLDYGMTLDAAKDQYAILAGRDEILLSFLALGAEGAVGSTYNYAAPIFTRIIAAYRERDLKQAQDWQAIVRRFVSLIVKAGGMAANKALMGLVTGIECGPVRSPLRNLTRAQVEAFRVALDQGGFFAALRETQAVRT